MDLAEWYAAGRWTGLLDLIDALPGACRLNEAIANDPEAAEEIARMPRPEGGEWSPRVSEYGLEHQMLRELIHEVKALKQISLKAAGGNPGDEKPFPAPRTAIDKAIEAAEREWAVSFAAMWGFSPEDI